MKARGLIEHLVRNGVFPSFRKGVAFFRRFENISFEGKRVLDIGCGEGWVSLYAACQGAEVVGLEPTGSGSSKEAVKACKDMQDALDLKFELLPYTIQEFISKKRFDVVLMLNSVNHLDERACISLRESQEARSKYLKLFKKISSLINHGGSIVITDYSRHNLFAFLRIKNPFSSSIEWDKHQSPKFWSWLLCQCGFENPHITWQGVPRSIDSFLIHNKLASYLTISKFWLVMRCPDIISPSTT